MRFSQPAGSFSSSAIFPRLRLPHPARPHWRGERRGEPTFFFFFFPLLPLVRRKAAPNLSALPLVEKKTKPALLAFIGCGREAALKAEALPAT